MQATTIRFGEDLWEVLEREATKQCISTAQLIREAAIMRVAALAAHRGDDGSEISLQALAERAVARRRGSSAVREAGLHPDLDEPWATRGETPLSYAICTEAIAYREPLVLKDVRRSEDLCNSEAVTEMEVAAYVGIPLITDRGHVLGALCAIDHEPRDWSEEQVELVKTLARAVMDHIERETSQGG